MKQVTAYRPKQSKRWVYKSMYEPAWLSRSSNCLTGIVGSHLQCCQSVSHSTKSTPSKVNAQSRSLPCVTRDAAAMTGAFAVAAVIMFACRSQSCSR